METRRAFLDQLAGIGLFTILPGAGRIWQAERRVLLKMFVQDYAVPEGMHHQDFLNEMRRRSRLPGAVPEWEITVSNGFSLISAPCTWEDWETKLWYKSAAERDRALDC